MKYDSTHPVFGTVLIRCDGCDQLTFDPRIESCTNQECVDAWDNADTAYEIEKDDHQ